MKHEKSPLGLDLEVVVNAMQETLSVIDMEGNFLFANAKATHNLSGGKLESIVGRNIRDFVPLEEAEKLVATYRRVIEEGEPVQQEVKVGMSRIDRWFLNTMQPLRYGTIDALLSISLDITDRKKTEEELRVSERRNQMLADLSMEGIVIHRNGIASEMNASVERMFGYKREELLNRNFLELVVEEDRGHVRENIVKEYASPYEVRAMRRDGEIFYIEIESINTQLMGESWRVTAIRDITARKKAGEALISAQKKAEESDLRFKNYIQTSPTSVFLLDGRGKFTFVNNAACKLLGYSESELLQLEIFDLVTSNERQELLDIQSTLMNAGEVRNIESKFVRKDGGLIDVISDGKRLSDNEFIAFVKDITDRKLMEDELRHAKERAEESDRLKSAFLANMSHEIRTPMNGIMGFASLLKEPGLTGSEQQEYIRIIEKSGTRMLNTINEIVDISKIESGLMEVDITEVDVNEVMDFAHRFFKPEAEAKGLSLTYTAGLQSPDSIITTDREKLHAILSNLIKNAVKYTRSGSIVFGYGSNELAPVTDSEQRANLVFFVQDSGIGIPANRQEAIFERFIQADVIDKHAYQGAGLGLSISKAYVKMLGGNIWVESVEGQGSIFYFTIPYDGIGRVDKPFSSPPNTRVENQEADLEPSLPKVLIAEDDETSVFLLTEVLKSMSREFLVVKTGLQAIDACRSHPDIDVILMDIRMPEMDGYEAIRRIRNFNPNVYIIAQTAHGLTGDREKALEAGADEYIAKPIPKADLLNILKKRR